MSHSYASLLTHAVFSTKERLPLIAEECRERIHAYLGGVARQLKGRALTIGGTADHVHILLSLPPTICVADALRDMKSNTSGWVHETWPARSDFAWQTGYGAFSVSQSSCEAVTEYIRNQEPHHHRMTFQEEFLILLKKHGIEYDERYIWA
jgi:putative transposase